jgi:hypothetical protein
MSPKRNNELKKSKSFRGSNNSTPTKKSATESFSEMSPTTPVVAIDEKNITQDFVEEKLEEVERVSFLLFLAFLGHSFLIIINVR